MGIRSFIRMLFGLDAPAPLDATKLDATTEATLTPDSNHGGPIFPNLANGLCLPT